MSHEECPLCRNNYLSLDDEDGEGGDAEDSRPVTSRTQDVLANEDPSSLFQRMHLFYILSQLQNLANDTTNRAITIEGIELPDSRRGNVETGAALDADAESAARTNEND